jgi:drug/metabolite transporter (DMT)-like permease
LRSLGRRERWLVVAAGGFLGVHFGVWITSLSFTSTAASLALVATNPMFAALLGLTVGDRVTAREWTGIAVAAAGCALLAGGDWRAGGDALVGDGLAVLGAATAAAYLVVGRRLREALPLFPYLAVVNGVAGGGLLVAALVAGVGFGGWGDGVSPWCYAAIAGSALFASVGGHTMLNLAVRRTPTHLVALAVLGEPVGASLISWAAFGEVPPWTAGVGGVVILCGIGVGFSAKR